MSETDDLVTYQFDMPRDEWREWTGTITKNVNIDDHLRGMMAKDLQAERDIPEVKGSEVLREFCVEYNIWDEWTETLPRSLDIDTRIQQLIEKDAEAARRDTDVEPESIGVFASRIRIRALQAIGALRDDDDPEHAIEQLEDIREFASIMES